MSLSPRDDEAVRENGAQPPATVPSSHPRPARKKPTPFRRKRIPKGYETVDSIVLSPDPLYTDDELVATVNKQFPYKGLLSVASTICISKILIYLHSAYMVRLY